MPEYTGQVIPASTGGAKPYSGDVLPLTGGSKSPSGDSGEPSAYDTVKKAILQGLSPIGAVAGVGEAALSMGSGMLAKPVSDIAGLAAAGKEMVSPTTGGGDPSAFKQHVQQSLTYQPRTPLGQVASKYNPVSLAGMIVGKGAEAVGDVARGDITASPTRNAVGNLVEEGLQQAPGLLGAKAGIIPKPPTGAAPTGFLRNQAEAMMTRALKPTVEEQASGKGASAAKTMLDEGVNVSHGGVSKLETKVNDINTKIRQQIDASPAIVKKDAVAGRLTGLLDQFKKQVNPSADVKVIQKAWDEFLNHPLLNSDDIPVKLAQEMKQGTYRAVKGKAYGELKGAEIEAQKTLARGLKEEIAQAVPAVRDLNAQESKLLDALSVTERRVLNEARANPGGLGWLTSSPEKFAGYMADKSALFKSLIARMLNAGAVGQQTVGRAMPALGVAVSANRQPPGPGDLLPLPPQ